MSSVGTRSKKAQSKEKELSEVSPGSSESSERTTSTEQTTSTEKTTSTEQSDDTRKSGETTITLTGKETGMTARRQKNETRVGQRRRAEIEAKLELLKKKKEQADAAAELAQSQMELLRLDGNSDPGDVQEIDPVNDWVERTRMPPNQDTEISRGVNLISDLLTRAMKQSNERETTPKRPPAYMSELCVFDGDPINWIPFSSHYHDTSVYFSDVENLARIRKALKGIARDAVKSLLYTSTRPDIILRELERRFGQPTHIIRSEISELEKLPRMPEDVRGIGAFASAVFNSVNTIKQLNRIEYLYSTDIADRVVAKMNAMVKFRWQEFKASRVGEPILNVLSDFLNMISDQFDEPGLRPKYKMEPSKNRPPIRRRVNAANKTEDISDSESEYDSEFEEEMQLVLAASSIGEEKCQLCEQPHDITKCGRFTNEPIKERWELVKKLKLCFRCLKMNHRHVTCKAKPCSKEGCSRRHHELLHQDRPKPEANKIVSVNHIGTTRAFLKIIPVELSGPRGSETVLALLDEGSTVTLLVDEVANQIGATGPRRDLVIEGISGHQMKTEQSQNVEVKIKGLFSREYQDMQAFTIDRLNLRSQSITKRDLEDCPHLDDISDQLLYDAQPPALLIGQDNWHLIVSREIRSGHPSKPVASLTRLGWILHGCQTDPPRPVSFVNHAQDKKLDSIDQLIKDHFSLDSLGITTRKPANDSEQRALTILDNTTRRLPEGRFECGMLWRTDNEIMPINRNSALRRLQSIEKKFKKDDKLKVTYTEQIRNLLKNNYAEIAPCNPTSQRTWYLPHFAVIHPQKGKIRVVFDAAEKTNGKSLNDALLCGPDLLQSLFGVLTRFRQGPVAVAADIKEMFLRITIREEDRDSLRFLWRENESDPEPREYRMRSLIFGATSSPCSAIFVKNRNAQEFEAQYPDAANAIQRCHYMDDYLQSFATTDEASRISGEVDLVHKRGGFELRGWTSNHPASISALNEQQPDHVNLGVPNAYGTTLGMLWQTSTDSFRFAPNLRNTPEEVLHQHRPPTKREVASAIMSVFDPLGLASPVLIQGKVLIQQLWRAGINWDDPIPPNITPHWSAWLKNITCLEELHIPRCTRAHKNGELHTFVDASENVYAAASYWRTEEPDGKISIALIAAKAKVAPLKPTSIPRLELQAALLGSRLAANIEREMDATITRKTFWSDSRTVLAWIKSDPRSFKTFVAHRLAEIEDLTKPTEWRYVPTQHNVADDSTKSPPLNFDHTHRWFTGPTFLADPPDSWPEDRSARPTPQTGEERTHVAVATERPRATPPLDYRRFSSWTRYLRATARLLQCVDRFKSLVKKPDCVAATKPIVLSKSRRRRPRIQLEISKTSKPESSVPPLSKHHLCKAEKIILQSAQKESFKCEIRTIKAKKPIPKTSRLKKLTLTMKNGLLCLETRLTAAEDLSATYKKPVILDGQHPITRLIIENYHKCNHGNHNNVMNEIRQRFYITSLRNDPDVSRTRRKNSHSGHPHYIRPPEETSFAPDQDPTIFSWQPVLQKLIFARGGDC